MTNSPLAKLQLLTKNKTLAHAWLLTGADDDYKLQCAQQFSKWLLCTNQQHDFACDHCKSCLLFAADVHPDLYVVTPTEDRSSIVIEDIRSVIEFTVGKPQFSTHKIVTIHPAQAMHKQAANALLKSLEDPAGQTIFFLLTKHADLLLDTVVSRCQQINFNAQTQQLDPAVITAITEDLNTVWIKKTSTISQIVEKWIKQWPDQVLYFVDMFISDMIRFKYTNEAGILKYSNIEQMTIFNTININALWTILNRIKQAQFWQAHNYNPNLQLILEDALYG